VLPLLQVEDLAHDLSYGPHCRRYAIIAQQNRKPPAGVVPTDAEKLELFGGFVACAGTYTIDRDGVSHHVDVSWIEARTGTTRVRRFKIAGKVLRIQSIPAENPRDGRLSSSSLVWTKGRVSLLTERGRPIEFY
jgi:Lipocalin-like domain